LKQQNTKSILNPLWGYELTLPEGWLHRLEGDKIFISNSPEGLQPLLDTPPPAAQLLVMTEWNGLCLPLEPIWNQHIEILKDGFNPKDVRQAPWTLAGAVGTEAELGLRKRDNTFLWTGILTRDLIVLQFMLTYKTENTEVLKSVLTDLIASLRFVEQVEGIETNQAGIPLPPGYVPADPLEIVPDINTPNHWEAYSTATEEGAASLGALQAFYKRELAPRGWQVTEYIPYPGQMAISFARFSIRQEDRKVILGIMPPDEKADSPKAARVVIRYN
jgi:hypothetical protein